MVDEEVIADKLRYVNEYTDDLRRMRETPKQTYLDDTITQRAVERTFEVLIQACIDLARHICSAEELLEGSTARDAIRALGDAGVIKRTTREKMPEAAGFRNVLAHRYGDVDHEIVYDVLQEDLVWFERFQQEIAQWLQSCRS